VYFSRAGENYHYGGRRNLETGNTEVLAGMIRERIGCAVHRLEAAQPYPEAYQATVDRNVREQRNNARPAIAGGLPEVRGYTDVLLGCPVWNVRAPMILSTLLDRIDLRGKTVHPFVTYAVSGMGSVEDEYRRALSGVDVRPGLAVQGERVTEAGAAVETWLREGGLLA